VAKHAERFVRRLIIESSIQLVHVGRHVRIADTVLDAFVGGVVEPMLLRPARTSR
jgi:hypothetical protein